MEVVLVTPIALAFFLGMVEFSMLLYARQMMLAASREGARAAARGADQDEVQQTVVRALGAGRLADADIAMTTTEGYPLQSAAEVHSGEPIEIWVRLPATHAVPDLLRIVGYSIANDEIVARTVMRKE
jgi:hypothetical protein